MSYTYEIQTKARSLLESKQVDCVIGYEIGPRGRTRPAFIYQPEEVERLVWNQACTHNLTIYLKEQLDPQQSGRLKTKEQTPRHAAVVVKACDSRAINVLLAENHFGREQLHVIGVVCDGIHEGAGEVGNQRSVRQFPAADPPQFQARCQRCIERVPVVFDTFIGERPSNQKSGMHENVLDDLDCLQAMTPTERTDFWLSQFDRCIRCYACRQACPMCSCPTCLYERDDSLWVGMGIGLNEKRTFHLGRAFHLAGRCIGCDECERVCPMDIPISLLNRRLIQEVETVFGYRAGMAQVPPPFVTVLSDR